MTRLFLAAGVAALAITAPASAKPDRQRDGNERAQVVKQKKGEAQRAQRAERVSTPRAERTERVAAFQQRMERRVEREKPQRAERMQTRVTERQQVRTNRDERATNRVKERQQVRANQVERAQNRVADRQQVESVKNRAAERQQIRANRVENAQNRIAQRPQAEERRVESRVANRQELRANRAERIQDRVAMREALRNQRIDQVRGFRPLPDRLVTNNVRIRPFGETVRFVGQPVRNVTNVVRLAALPSSVAYLYPDTTNYYYRYGDGYVYRVDRNDDIIDWVLPMLAGGFLPGQYLPSSYMNSYMPSYYGFNSFYPDYGNDCHRYGYGVVYETDCYTGLVEDVIPLYAGGYGVGQLLPSSYSYYNVPMQYRGLYYDTPNTGYWYGPGAIYQYDRDTAMISSVAALLSPGFSVGQQLPLGYNMYNVPLAYRSTYYDTPNAWYRYNNGYIYQVDPSTMLVTALVASILT
jgi:hypothetical protein